jgi:hypothetical protein
VIGSAVVATTETTLSDHSVIVANNHVFSLIPKPLLIPSGFLVSAIGSAPVSYLLNSFRLFFFLSFSLLYAKFLISLCGF